MVIVNIVLWRRRRRSEEEWGGVRRRKRRNEGRSEGRVWAVVVWPAFSAAWAQTA